MQNFACTQGGEKTVDTMPISAPRQAGIYVRRAREAQGLTRAQLATAAGVSERLLASLELGDATGIRLDKLLAVFDALGLSLRRPRALARGAGREDRVACARSDSRDGTPETRSRSSRCCCRAHIVRSALSRDCS